MKILIVTPAPPQSRSGNRVTALRWSRLLRDLGHHVTIGQRYRNQRCDLIVALHARRSASSLNDFRHQHAQRPIVLALTGTDLYLDLPTSSAVKRSITLADRLVVLQPLALAQLPPSVRIRARVIFQSVPPPRRRRPPRRDIFEVCVIGHLRSVKDPFRTALAARALPRNSRVRVLHLGAALSEEMARGAREEERRNPRYRWLGDQPRWRTRHTLTGCRLMVLSSLQEGGANVVSEAIAASIPVLSSRIAGSQGILGREYPGFFPPKDTAALASLLQRAEHDSVFYQSLQKWCKRLLPLVNPDRERSEWQRLLAEL